MSFFLGLPIVVQLPGLLLLLQLQLKLPLTRFLREPDQDNQIFGAVTVH